MSEHSKNYENLKAKAVAALREAGMHNSASAVERWPASLWTVLVTMQSCCGADASQGERDALAALLEANEASAEEPEPDIALPIENVWRDPSGHRLVVLTDPFDDGIMRGYVLSTNSTHGYVDHPMGAIQFELHVESAFGWKKMGTLRSMFDSDITCNRSRAWHTR